MSACRSFCRFLILIHNLGKEHLVIWCHCDVEAWKIHTLLLILWLCPILRQALCPKPDDWGACDQVFAEAYRVRACSNRFCCQNGLRLIDVKILKKVWMRLKVLSVQLGNAWISQKNIKTKKPKKAQKKPQKNAWISQLRQRDDCQLCFLSYLVCRFPISVDSVALLFMFWTCELQCFPWLPPDGHQSIGLCGAICKSRSIVLHFSPWGC